MSRALPVCAGRKNRSMKIACAAVWILLALAMKPEGLMAEAEPPADLQSRIFLAMKPEKTKAYQNEKILLTITLYSDGLSIRDIRYPQFGHEGFTVEELGQPVQGTEVIVGKTYSTMEFTTSIIPRKTGDLTLGPAGLQCQVHLPPSPGSAEAFFGGQETYTLNLKSEKVIVQTLPLPREGKPPDFQNAVGRFDLAVEVHPREVKTGDPVRVTMAIKGSGALHDLPCPVLDLSKSGESQFKLTAPRLIQTNDALICEQVFIPLSEKADAIPRIHFSFFNPEAETYTTLNQGPFPLKVTGPSSAVPPEAKTVEEAKGILDHFRRSPGLYLSLLLLTMFFLALLIVAYQQRFVIIGFIKEKLRRFHRARQIKMALRKAEKLLDDPDSQAFYTIIFRTLQEFLGDAFQIHPAGITEDIIMNVLRPKGLDEAFLGKIEMIFRLCDRARYASGEFGREEREGTLTIMKEVMGYKRQDRSA